MLSVRPCWAASLLYKLATAASETYGLLTKREVKMAGYWPHFFFLRVYGPRLRHAKRERGQYPVILTEQAWPIKDFLYDLKH